VAGPVRHVTAAAGLAAGCSGISPDHGQDTVEQRLTALRGVEPVDTRADLEFPEAIDVTLAESATPDDVTALRAELAGLDEKSGLPKDWTTAKIRIKRPNGSDHPDELRSAITCFTPEVDQHLRDWMSVGDEMTGAVVLFDVVADRAPRFVVLGDAATIEADKKAAAGNPLVENATFRARGDHDDNGP